MDAYMHLTCCVLPSQTPALERIQEGVESVLEGVSSLDRKLQFHMALTSGSMDQLGASIRDIHQSILEEAPQQDHQTTPSPQK